MATAATLKLAFLPSVLKTIGTNNLSGCLTATSDDNLIKFYFKHGQLYDARQSRPTEIRGYDALYAILSWQIGELTWTQEASDFSSLDAHQVSVFNKAVLILYKSPDEISARPIPPAFFHPVSSHDWAATIRDGQHTYQGVAATSANYERVVKAFATSHRSGVVQVSLDELDSFYLFEQGRELGKYCRHDEPPYFLPDFSTWSLLDQPGGTMDVFLEMAASIPASIVGPVNDIDPVAPSSVDEPTAHTDIDENNPYDF